MYRNISDKDDSMEFRCTQMKQINEWMNSETMSNILDGIRRNKSLF